jgi:ribosomal protein S18 acetylase RimI-like enzyme
MNKFSYKQLAWDASLLGFPCGEISLLKLPSNTDQKILASQIKDLLANKEEKLIVVKLPNYFNSLFPLFVRKNCTFIDTEITFEYTGNKCQADIGDFTVEFTKQCDPKALRPLAEEMLFSRYYLDKKIQKNIAHTIWLESISNHCTGLADEVAVAYSGKKPAGVITVSIKNTDKINLHIVGVLKKFQGQGVGTALLRNIIARYCESHAIFVEAMSLNSKAVNFYQKNGFTVRALHYVLHIWN